jgi:hypothetical protein
VVTEEPKVLWTWLAGLEDQEAAAVQTEAEQLQVEVLLRAKDLQAVEIADIKRLHIQLGAAAGLER